MELSDPQDPDRAQAQARAQEIIRAEKLAREEARTALWAGLTLRRRLATVAALLLTFAVGILIGVYGFGQADDSAGAGLAPPEHWGREIEPDQAEGVASEAAATPTAWPLSVYVSGAVATAQVVQVPPGSLVADVLDLAGGTTADADLDALNLAATVSDNQHVLVPTLRPSVEAGPVSVPEPLGSERLESLQVDSSVDAFAPIDINTASVADLDSLPEIGSTRAEAIVAYREANGPFRQIADILLVPGIGPTIYERIAPLITVGP